MSEFLLCSRKRAPEEDASGVEEQQVGVRITDELRNITRAGLLPGMVMGDALIMTLKPPKSLRCGKAKTEMTTSRIKASPKSAISVHTSRAPPSTFKVAPFIQPFVMRKTIAAPASVTVPSRCRGNV
jgi:hypothetical protein